MHRGHVRKIRPMSRHIIKTPGLGLSALALSGASLLLASCGTSPVALSAEGQPSLSLDTPLTTVSCTTTGACIALGASGSSNAPTTGAQVRNHRGDWSALNVPTASLASFYDSACAATTCFFGGTQSTGDLLWSINANTGAVAILKSPANGLVNRNLSCASDTECTTIDQAANNLTRLSSTSDAGVTWSAPRTLAWAANKTTALDCPSAKHCYVATTSTRHVVTLRETIDAGATWDVVATPRTWTSLASVYCTTTCTALVSTAAGSAVVTQSKLTWKETPLTFTASFMACESTTTCLVVGRLPGETPAMAQWRVSGARSFTLTYVPSPLTDVACGATACVAIGVTTVVALRP